MTTTLLQIQADTILRRAAESETGIRVRVIEPLRARQTLYRFRKELQREEYLKILIKPSPDYPLSELWLINLNNVASDAVPVSGEEIIAPLDDDEPSSPEVTLDI